MEYFKASAQKAYPLRLTDPEPIKNTAAIWRAVAQFSTIGVFFLLLCTALVLARTVLVPVAGHAADVRPRDAGHDVR